MSKFCKRRVEFWPSLSYINIFSGILYLIYIFSPKILSCRLYIAGSVVKRQNRSTSTKYNKPLLYPLSPIKRDFKVYIIYGHFWVLSLLPQWETMYK